MKNYKKTVIITIVLVLLPMLAGLWFYNALPNPMATHFNAATEADGYMPKPVAVFGLPLIIAFVELICVFAMKKDPKNENNIRSKEMAIVIWVMPVLSWLCYGMTLAYNLGRRVKMTPVVSVFIGLLFIVLGNYLPKVKQNYTLGIKTPWAMNDSENWLKTHRVGGMCFVAAGVLVIAAGLLGKLWLMFVGIGLVIVIPFAYSYALYEKKQKAERD